MAAFGLHEVLGETSRNGCALSRPIRPTLVARQLAPLSVERRPRCNSRRSVEYGLCRRRYHLRHSFRQGRKPGGAVERRDRVGAAPHRSWRTCLLDVQRIGIACRGWLAGRCRGGLALEHGGHVPGPVSTRPVSTGTDFVQQRPRRSIDNDRRCIGVAESRSVFDCEILRRSGGRPRGAPLSARRSRPWTVALRVHDSTSPAQRRRYSGGSGMAGGQLRDAKPGIGDGGAVRSAGPQLQAPLFNRDRLFARRLCAGSADRGSQTDARSTQYAQANI